MEPWLSVVVMTPATAPPAETAVVPVMTVCATVVVEPLLAAAWTSEQKLFPTEMALDGSTPAALHTAVEQSRTPKAKFMLLQRQV